jgi:ketosteroid isomerase-like protein
MYNISILERSFIFADRGLIIDISITDKEAYENFDNLIRNNYNLEVQATSVGIKLLITKDGSIISYMNYNPPLNINILESFLKEFKLPL